MPAVDKYVIMPNHIHVIFHLTGNGPTRTSAPTVPSLVRYLKRAVTMAVRENIWQRSYYDHIIRDQHDYETKWQYIDTNPARWREDELYEESYHAGQNLY